MQFASKPELWTKHGLEVTISLATVLETCMAGGDGKRVVRIQDSALVASRRAIRHIFRSSEIGEDAVGKLVGSLTAKGASSTAGNAVLLGVIAGVSSRLPSARPILESYKSDYFAFYVREIVGSRTQLPDHIANALHDFFDSFPTLDELRATVFPSMEKALLRAPEVVLNNIVSRLILALPETMDLSDILLKNLLKPLLANVKSTNPNIRAGALRTFQALASRSGDAAAICKVADEILNPMKQGKVSGADQKVLHAQLLSNLPESATLAEKISAGVAPVALKETNEPALVAELSALAKHLTFALANGIALDKALSDAFIKGIADKKIPVRRLWAIRAADIWWALSPEQFTRPDILSFCQATLPKLMEMWQEAVANPIPATQSGLATVGHYVTALLATKVRTMDDPKLATIYKKSDVINQTFMVKPKPSLLLNSRVFSKVTSEEDIEVALRALTSVVPWFSKDTVSDEAREAWAHAFIFFIVAHGIPSKAKAAARRGLTETYVQSPAEVSRAVVAGLWSWYKSDASGDKDSASAAAKTGSGELSTVLGCLFIPEEISKKHGLELGADALRQQLISILVLARPELIPRTSWIDTCLRVGVDPGQLVREHLDECLSLIDQTTTASLITIPSRYKLTLKQDSANAQFSDIALAAHNAYTDLAFVAPDVALPVVVNQFSRDLDPSQLEAIGPTEAAIFRTPEGTAYIDVLSKKAPVSIDKNTKDYDTLKWEEDLRAQLAQKKGQAKKLSAEEQAKVNAQIAKESAIRHEVSVVERKMRRGVGIIQSLALGPPTEAEQWMGPAVNLLIQSIRAGAGLLLGDLPAVAFIKCSQRISTRLGPLRPFVGVATLRTIGSIQLSSEYEQIDLGGMPIVSGRIEKPLTGCRFGDSSSISPSLHERATAARSRLARLLLPPHLPDIRERWDRAIDPRRIR